MSASAKLIAILCALIAAAGFGWGWARRVAANLLRA